MKLVSWNVNGLRSVCNKGFVDFVRNERPDVLCLQETKLPAEDEIGPNPLADSHAVHYCSASKKGYSGLATFLSLTKKECSTTDVRQKIGIKKFDTEARFLITRFPSFTLYNVYIPPAQPGKKGRNLNTNFLTHSWRILFLCRHPNSIA